MSFYPQNVGRRASNPAFAREITGANATGVAASLACGSSLRYAIEIDRETLVVNDIGFRSNGCGFAIAAADRIAETILGQPLRELHGLELDQLAAAITDALGDIPAERRQCVAICIDALRAALAKFRTTQIEEFTGEHALICTCFGVDEPSIERAISAGHLRSVAAVTAKTGAGAGCGSCRMLIQEMLDTRDG